MEFAEYGQYVNRLDSPEDTGRVTGIDMVHERVRALATGPVPTVDEWWPLLRSIAETASAAPSVVLEDRDREVAARALEDAAKTVDDMTFAGAGLRDSIARWLRAQAHVERAAAIRKGDTNA